MSVALNESFVAALETASLYGSLRHAARDVRRRRAHRVQPRRGRRGHPPRSGAGGQDLGVTPRVFLLDTRAAPSRRPTIWSTARAIGMGSRWRSARPTLLAVESLVPREGSQRSFHASVDDSRRCYGGRKVGPLARSLAGARVWVTGLRQEQSRRAVRRSVTVEYVQPAEGLAKMNPLAGPDERARVGLRPRTSVVPTHALHARELPIHRLRPVHARRRARRRRARTPGRWWWENEATQGV